MLEFLVGKNFKIDDIFGESRKNIVECIQLAIIMDLFLLYLLLVGWNKRAELLSDERSQMLVLHELVQLLLLLRIGVVLLQHQLVVTAISIGPSRTSDLQNTN